MKKNIFTKRMLLANIIGYLVVIVFLWLNEILDIPYCILGAKSTPVNIAESLFETVFIISLGALSFIITLRFIKRIKYLEGFLRICSYCKKIYTGNAWIPIADFLRNHSDAKFTHGLCPSCWEKHYMDPLDKGI